MVERNYFGGKFDYVLRGIVFGWRMFFIELKKKLRILIYKVINVFFF